MINGIIAVVMSAISGAVMYRSGVRIYTRWQKSYIDKYKGPELSELAKSDPGMLIWMQNTQILVDAIVETVAISGRSVKGWSSVDVMLISNRIGTFVKEENKDENK